MSAREHASPNGPPWDPRIPNADQGAVTAQDPLRATRAEPRAEQSPRAKYTPYLESVRSTRAEYAYSGQGGEALATPGLAPARGGSRWLAGLAWVATGLGLCGAGVAIAAAPQHRGPAEALWFVSMIIPFAILLTILMVGRLGRLRVFIIAVVGVYPALVFRMSSPLVLAGFDEHLHEQELLNLLRGSGLFAANPGLRVGPFYPGLEIFTGFAIRLTDIPVMLGMNLAVLFSRLMLVLLIYYGALLISPSRRGASLAVAFYSASPQFYEFNSQFAYQTLALTLGVGGLVLLRKAQSSDSATARRLRNVASLVLVVTVITHHVTGWLTLAFLVAWAIMSPRGAERKILVRAALIMGTAAVIWTGTLAAPLAGYFVPIMSNVIQTARAFVQGTSGHQVFGANGGTPASPKWETAVLALYVLTCAVGALVCAWIMISRAFQRHDRLLGLLGVLSLLYPACDAAYFNPPVGELGDRASTFLFFPLALSASLIVMRSPRVARPTADGKRPAADSKQRKPFRPIVLTALISVTVGIYFGGTLLGSNPDYSRLPGPYLVSADSRTQDPETLAAVEWAAEHLPPGSTVTADRVPAVLLDGQARLAPISEPSQGLDPSALYFSNTWTQQDTAIVKGLRIDYLYVDMRLSQSLPYLDYYIHAQETLVPTRLTVKELSKFRQVPGLTAVYHHGPVTIYSTYGLGVVPKREGFQGYHSMGAGPWDAAIGVVVVLLLMLMRRRLAWVIPAARDIGTLGTTLAVIAASIFVGGALFAFRIMPGPAFSLGVIATSAVILAVQRLRRGQRLVPRLPFSLRFNPLILLGFAAGVAGVLIAVHAAWIIDVTDVHAILQSVS
jgi:hypothetical protein